MTRRGRFGDGYVSALDGIALGHLSFAGWPWRGSLPSVDRHPEAVDGVVARSGDVAPQPEGAGELHRDEAVGPCHDGPRRLERVARASETLRRIDHPSSRLDAPCGG